MEQYLEEGLFLLELIGIKVFKKDGKKQRKGTHSLPDESKTLGDKKQPGQNQTSDQAIPPLPSDALKVGEFVYTAMQTLSDSGFSFDSDKILEMTTSDWSKATFHTKYPFMKVYIPGETNTKGEDGKVRFKSAPYKFGQHKVLISLEWFESQRQLFIDWYNSL